MSFDFFAKECKPHDIPRNEVKNICKTWDIWSEDAKKLRAKIRDNIATSMFR